jgi:hypothetical protein
MIDGLYERLIAFLARRAFRAGTPIESVARILLPIINKLAPGERFTKRRHRLIRAVAVTRCNVDEEAWIAERRSARLEGRARQSEREASKNIELALDLLSALVPKRIGTEEIGDALEFINRMMAKNKPSFLIYLKVITTFWWVILHAFLHYAERAAGIVKATVGVGSSKNDSKT